MRDPRPWLQTIISLMVAVAALYALVGSVTTFWLARGKDPV
jgi:hypothetical protein